jgi:hypothetical protein
MVRMQIFLSTARLQILILYADGPGLHLTRSPHPYHARSKCVYDEKVSLHSRPAQPRMSADGLCVIDKWARHNSDGAHNFLDDPGFDSFFIRNDLCLDSEERHRLLYSGSVFRHALYSCISCSKRWSVDCRSISDI